MDCEKKTRELLEALPTMTRANLEAIWKEHFGKPAPAGLKAVLMRPVLAFHIQERLYGVTARELGKIACPLLERPSAVTRFRPGTRIVREWRGVIHEVSVTIDGFDYRGTTYRSLSPIATCITGTKWSGPAFFGTKAKGHPK